MMIRPPSRLQIDSFLNSKLDEYWEVLQASPMTDKSIEDYYLFAEYFTRWIAGEFHPGERIK